jgi:hypothetical protein
MAPKWDDTFKRLFAASSQDFVQWLMPGATLLEKAPLELKTTTKSATRMYFIKSALTDKKLCCISNSRNVLTQ